MTVRGLLLEVTEGSEAISPVMAGDCFGKNRLAMTAPLIVMLPARPQAGKHLF